MFTYTRNAYFRQCYSTGFPENTANTVKFYTDKHTVIEHERMHVERKENYNKTYYFI